MTVTPPHYRQRSAPAIKPVWSDGVHTVRPASKKDKHPMRWVIRSASKPFKVVRHAPTEEEAIELASSFTSRLVKQASKSEKKVLEAAKAQAMEVRETPPASKVEKLERKELPPFSTYHFNCIRANPVAQVWQCVSLPGERANVGRRAKGGRPNRQSAFNHTKTECAVLIGREPVRNRDGSVRVFKMMEAEHYALDLYYNADEEERPFWQEGDKVVLRTRHVDVIFDPDCNSEKKPFSLWVHLPGGGGKPVYEGYHKTKYAKAGALVGGGTYMPSTPEQAAALEFNRKLAAIAAEDRVELSTREATFESIWRAEHHALTVTEPTLRGERVRL